MIMKFSVSTKRLPGWSRVFFSLLLLVIYPASSMACTTLSLRSDNGAVVSIMNMEFPVNLDYTLNHIPRGIRFQGEDFSGLEQKHWTGQHQVIGTGGKSDTQSLGAGLNEKGLFVTTLYLRDRTRYQEINPGDEGNFISPMLLPTYLLTQYETVDEIKEALQSIKVANISASGFYNIVPTYHWMVTDRNYQSLVIEYTDGELKLYDNPYHAMTNAPTFDFHLNNMRTYAFLNNSGYPQEGKATNATGAGFGTLGMPGDFTPTGRFVRAAFFAKNSSASDNTIMKQAAEVSNALIYPSGVAVYNSQFSKQKVSQKTMYAFIANSQTGEILFRRYGDLNWRALNFDDFKSSRKITAIEVFDDWKVE